MNKYRKIYGAVIVSVVLMGCDQEEKNEHAGPTIDVAADLERSPRVNSVMLQEESSTDHAVYEQDSQYTYEDYFEQPAYDQDDTSHSLIEPNYSENHMDNM